MVARKVSAKWPYLNAADWAPSTHEVLGIEFPWADSGGVGSVRTP